MKQRLTLLLLFFSITTFARVGIADWSVETPHGNEINNFSEKTLYLKNGQELRWVADWYFYKNNIIGRLGDKERYGDTTGYFVVNEITLKIDTFQSKSEWTKFIIENDLKPKLWTRSYRNNWKVLDSILIYTFIGGFHLTIPLTVLFLIVLYRAIKREKLNWKAPYTIGVLIVFGVLFVRWLLDIFPESW